MKGNVIDLSGLTPTTPFLLRQIGEVVRVGRSFDPKASGSMDDDAVAGAPLWAVVKQLEGGTEVQVSSDEELLAFGRLVILTRQLLGEAIEDLDLLMEALAKLGVRRAA
jgi:hypothetical protein